MRRQIIKATVSTACAVAMLAGATLPAYAATGRFVYRLQAGRPNLVVNPQSLRCIGLSAFGQTVRLVSNGTDEVANMYVNRNCTGAPIPVAPGEQRDFDEPISAVMFVPR
ncbi:hypothetical protein ACFYY8_21285 [Streptosporangium sp. NPDC001559]|uniref:hypothetical protein n=1 Tax=Streptosporangium sp. NPDC001559 TaxID=3366187 RepID=UPI0036E2AD54